MNSEVIFRAEHMYKSFGVTKAVVDFSMELKAGEIHGLIGENGSGKSTFSSMVAGLYKPDSGDMFMEGQPYAPNSTGDASQRNIALVAQEIGTIGAISVASNIFLNKENQFANRGMLNFRKMNAAAREILDQIGGEHINPSAITESLNLEDRKLVEIAQAMYCNPKVLIIDETSNALTTRGRRILYQNMRAVRDRGGCVLFITHDMNELVEMCDSVTIMRDGVFVATIEGKENLDTSELKRLMVGKAVDDLLAGFGRKPADRRTSYPGGESWQVGDSPVAGLLLTDHEGHYTVEGAPRFDKDTCQYQLRPGNPRKIRVYNWVDSHFILDDFFAKIKYCFGE